MAVSSGYSWITGSVKRCKTKGPALPGLSLCGTSLPAPSNGMLTQSAGRKQRMDVRHLMVVVLAVAGCSSKEEAPAAAAQDATMAPADRVGAATRIRAAATSLHTAPASPGSAVIAAAAKPAEGTFLTGERSLLSE